MKKCMIVLTSLLLTTALALAEESPKLEKPLFLFHFMGNLANDKTLTEIEGLIKKAQPVGYNGIAIIDSKFEKFALQDDHWRENVRKLRKLCTDNQFALVTGIAAIGYSAEMLANDPNLAEGLPVRDAEFVVKGGKLVPVNDAELLNGSFEDNKADQPKAWNSNSDPGKVTFIDDKVAHDGKVSVRIDNPGAQKGHGRVGQTIKLKPHHYYHLSAWVKTEGWTGKDMRFAGLNVPNLRWGTWMPPAIKETQDWTQIHAVFNSLDYDEMTVYFGTWGGKAGKLWIDDMKIEPASFVNVIRRDSLPVTVVSLDGKTTYEEGKDFSKIVDPKLGKDPNPGYFTVWHDAPEVTIPAGSKLKDGDKVRITYHHPITGSKPSQINCCVSEPKVYEILESQVKFLKEYAQPDAYFLQHDEIRHANTDDTCTKRKMTSGQLLADNIDKTAKIFQKIDNKPLVVWNDMFDPHHNARKEDKGGGKFIHYMVPGDGPFWESWKGLPKTMGIMNWSHAADSAKFFSDEGHWQIYSHADAAGITKWLDASGKNPGLMGIMFTNWEHDYSKMEEYMKAAKAWEKANGEIGKK